VSDALAILNRTLPAVLDDVLQLFNEAQVHKLALLADEGASILEAYGRQFLVQTAPHKPPTPKPPVDAESAAALIALGGRAYKVEKELEDLRVARVQPLNDEVRFVNRLLENAFADLFARMGKDGEADRLMKAYRNAERARIASAEEETRKALEAAALKEQEALDAAKNAASPEQERVALAAATDASNEQMRVEATAPRAQPRGIKTMDGSKSFRKVWKHEIVKPALVPRQFCSPDAKLIQAAVDAAVRANPDQPDLPEIPGVNIFDDEASRRSVL
jgi:hypothetical protein